MKILLIGKTGQLGGDILRNAGGHDIFAPGREVLDVTSRGAIESVIGDHRPDVVINTAAFHNVPQCEVEPLTAFRVNCVAVRDLAAICRDAGCRLVTFSSDYVFGGDKRTPYLEDDRPAPLQMYGISRLAGEHAALSTAPDSAIVIRTCGLYGRSGAVSKGGNFVDNRIADAAKMRELEMSCDQVVCPTSTDDLSKAVLALIEHRRAAPGLFHLVNEGECTWYEFTKAIYEVLGLDVKVTPVDRKGLSGTMRRPLYSVLANGKAAFLGIRLPHWRDALARYLKA
ncbi:MAG: dTDP-4-dehydrorhamnose reductase [Deltaproteobacteria bacterium]|nr:dTDP-4-dehydrorhamnose reductase [Deltaproteobacteria bacterium]